MPPLRSPLRRLGLWLVGALLAFNAFDFSRVLLFRSPREVEADQYVAPYVHEYVKVVGLLHFEESLAYQTVFPRSGAKKPPIALIPLNRPERSGGRVVLAEVPLVDGELPEAIRDGYRYEFVGLAGPLPSELRALVERGFPKGTVFTRLQVDTGLPSVATPLTWLACIGVLALCLARLARRYERSKDAREGFPQRISGFLLTLGLLLPVAVVWQRARAEPTAGGVLPPLLAFGFLLLFLTMAQTQRGRRLPAYERARVARPEEERWNGEAAYLDSRIHDGFEAAYGEEEQPSPPKATG